MSPTSFGPPFFLIAPGTPIAASPPGAGIRITGAVPAKGSPYSITERRVPELIPVLGSQRAGDVSHKTGGRLPLLSAKFCTRVGYVKH